MSYFPFVLLFLLLFTPHPCFDCLFRLILYNVERVISHYLNTMLDSSERVFARCNDLLPSSSSSSSSPVPLAALPHAEMQTHINAIAESMQTFDHHTHQLTNYLVTQQINKNKNIASAFHLTSLHVTAFRDSHPFSFMFTHEQLALWLCALLSAEC